MLYFNTWTIQQYANMSDMDGAQKTQMNVFS